MSDADMMRALAKTLGGFPTGTLCDADPRVRAMAAGLAPLQQGSKLSGPAKTVRIEPGQNRANHLAAHTAEPGDVLVIDGGGSRAFGPFGDLLAACSQNQGIAGLVIDGAVRDTEDIRKLGFSVFCLGACPTSTAKTDPGEIDVEICCGGVTVRPGDFIVGDDDGVVVVPFEIAADVSVKADTIARREVEIRRALDAGETTLEILGLVD